ncbi:ParB/RepB/Spo0J family partition protein [Paracraurococcus lichenis]|uniref:ParB/RepB/Spo0J family partition protein n=1 Tax=Paracraurococcus lichenis TaxID=3064888 RepID=A0ABT9EA45_9PROT|nr:ParB/RepB/Spo0J family partition protein [Paracraurococcus sp. LOR1-02]MDO9713081.1 ParB/RepB/Spo0J family partition protein [Paracraurococcus sp. LOR1-02]
MATGNKGFAAKLTGGAGGEGEGAAKSAAARLPPRTGILQARDNTLAQLARGAAVTRTQELVDPARCRIWEQHNRDYAALNETSCADLIESFKAQGKQEMPAIVRRLTGDPQHDFEVICGARRHWTVAWMRANNYPEFRFLIEPRELTDEEAFRLADLENRNRRDLSDYERACDYARALERHYEGSQQRMAERLEVSASWLSRFLELAKLPEEVVSAFASPHELRISHAASLAPLLNVPVKRNAILTEASAIASEQARLREERKPGLPAAAVVGRLVKSSAAPSKKPKTPLEYIVRTDDGAVLLKAVRASRGESALTISVPAPRKVTKHTLMSAIEEALVKLALS